MIGIGVGDPGHITQSAAQALALADVVFIPDKGDEKGDLKAARLDLARRFVRTDHTRFVEFAVPARDRRPADYHATVLDWHATIADVYAQAFQQHLGDDGCGALLVWGDPSLYDSTLRILASVEARVAIDVDVFPGITAIQALCARHRIPLNAIGGSVLITTGRTLAPRWPAGVGSLVVMLDGDAAFTRFDETASIFWGAYLGTPDEMLVSGRLAQVRDEILVRRSAARARKGWIMDIALLRPNGALTSETD